MGIFCCVCRNLDPDCTLPLRHDDQLAATGFSINSRLVYEFENSGAVGCGFCYFIYEALIFFNARFGVSSVKVALRIFADGAVDVSNLHYTIQLYTPLGFPAAWDRIQITPELSTTPFSEEALGFIRACLQRCSTQHEDCRSISSFMPTRLLDIEEATRGSIKLIEQPVCDTGRYIALSYCWGKEGNLKMTQGSMQSMKAGILVSNLPETIRDAVRVATALECRHVWVDALCIIQDSKEDWEIESSRMASVYSNAWLTLAASSAASATAGFLKSFKPTRTQDTFNFEWTNDRGCATILKARHIPVHYWQDTGYPLDQRAWTFQELVLSTRTALFTPDEIRWTCRSQKTCECQCWANHEPLQISAHSIKSPAEAYSIWKSIVRRYTGRSLTFVSDILPAIAGFAEVIQSITHSEYVAGLWKGSLISNLTWYVGSGVGAMDRSTHLEYIAPTFSWASVGYGVSFMHSSDETEMDLIEECQVVHVNASPLGRNPLGQVSDGCIQLRGFLISTVLTCGMNSSALAIPRVQIPHHLNVKHEHFYLDVALGKHTFLNHKGESETSVCRLRRGSDPLPAPFEIPVSVLYLGHTKFKDEDEVRQLLLVLGKSPNNPDAYERLGLLDLPYMKWEDRWIQFTQSALTTVLIL